MEGKKELGFGFYKINNLLCYEDEKEQHCWNLKNEPLFHI